MRQSLDRTNRLLVLHEATRTAGFGAELAVELGEIGFKLLDAPITRVTAEDLPVPTATPLADEIFSAEAGLRGAPNRGPDVGSAAVQVGLGSGRAECVRRVLFHEGHDSS